MQRGSVYKHLQQQDYKVDFWYPSVSSVDGGVETTMLDVSSTFLFLNSKTTGPGVVEAIPLSLSGRRKELPLRLTGHSNKILDMHHCPYNDNLLFTASVDSTVRVWHVPFPAVMGQTITPTSTLQGHTNKVDALAPHLAAPLLATASSDLTVRLWDVSTCSPLASVGVTDAIHCMDWMYQGNVLVGMNKSRKLQVIDVRAGNVVKEYTTHDGNKLCFARFVSKTDPFVMTTGFDRAQTRQYGIFDLRADTALCVKALPGSNSISKPVVDIDTSLVYVCGRGDSTTRIYEFDAKAKQPLTDITQHTTGASIKEIKLIPKRSVHTSGCEINSVFRLENDKVCRSGSYVIRKTTGRFHTDLYPDTLWLGQTTTPEEFMQGTINPPSSIAMQDISVMKDWEFIQYDTKRKEQYEAEQEKQKLAVETKKSQAEREKEEEERLYREAHKPPKVTRSSHFRHVNVRADNKNHNVLDLKINTNTSANLIRANAKWIGVPWIGTGKVAVFSAKTMGKVGEPMFCQFGANITDFAFDPFDDDVVYVVGEDGKGKVFRVHETSVETVKELKGHGRKINGVYANPYVAHCIVTVGMEVSLKMWDVEKGTVMFDVTGFGDMITNLSFDSTGERCVVGCKDKKIRVVDLRKGVIIAEHDAPQAGAKGFTVAWCGRHEEVMSVGFNKMSQRTYSLFGVEEGGLVEKTTQLLDAESTVVTPIYDADLDVVFFFGRNSQTVHCFEVDDEKPFVHRLNVVMLDTVAWGYDFAHKTQLNVKETEIQRLTMLVGSPPTTITRASLAVPRVKLEFFQDDIFPDTHAKVPTYTTDEWMGGVVKDTPMVSLQPDGMTKLSQATQTDGKGKYSSLDELKRREKEDQDKYNADIVSRLVESLMDKCDSDEDTISSEEVWSDD